MEGQAKKVAGIHEQPTGIVPVAQGLMEIAQALSGKAVASYGDVLKPLVHKVKQAEDRVAAGGHRSFQDEIDSAATKIWVAIDNAWGILGVCLRKSGSYFDPVYSAPPAVKTPLRPQLSMLSPEEKAAKAKATKKSAKKGKVTKGKTADNGKVTKGKTADNGKVTKGKTADNGKTTQGTDPAPSANGNGADGVQALTAGAPAKSAGQA